MHNHTISVPVVIGPLALRIVLLAAVCTVTGFAMLRAFLGKPNRATAAAVATSAAVGTVLTIMLTRGFDLPDQAAVLILAGIAVPLILAASRAPSARTARYAERVAPWVLAAAASAAFVEFARALAGGGNRVIVLHTGLMLAFVGLSWYTLGMPRSRPASLAVQVVAAALATAAIAGAGYATALTSGI